MIDLDGNVDLVELDRSMTDMQLRAKRLRPLWRDLRRPLRKDQSGHAKAQEGPSGSWPPRSPLTEHRRKARNRGVRITRAMKTIAIAKFPRRPTPKKILGRIPGAVVTAIGDLFIRETSRIPWSGAHQDGLRVGRGVRLPKRTFKWLSGAFVYFVRDTIGAYVVKGWKR